MGTGRAIFLSANFPCGQANRKVFFLKRFGGSGDLDPGSRYNVRVEITLRDSRREDFDRLWKLDQECFPPGISYSRVELALYMRRSGAFTVVAEAAAREHKRPADAAAQVVGFIVAEASRRGLGHIITIDVLPGARRCGVGSRLLTAAEQRLRTAQCSLVFLETAVDNGAAFAFYKRHGYFLVKTTPRYYSNGVDAFVLRKDLLPSADAG